MQLQTNFAISKVFEHIIASNIMKHFESNGILYHLQHGFQQHLSCETQLISLFHELAFNHDQGIQTDLVSMDFAKAFDTVSHKRLFYKLNWYGISVGWCTLLAGWFLKSSPPESSVGWDSFLLYPCKLRCPPRHCPWSHSFPIIHQWPAWSRETLHITTICWWLYNMLSDQEYLYCRKATEQHWFCTLFSQCLANEIQYFKMLLYAFITSH